MKKFLVSLLVILLLSLGALPVAYGYFPDFRKTVDETFNISHDEVATLTGQNAELNALIAEKTATINTLLAEVDALESEVALKTTSISLLNSQIMSLTSSYAEEIQQLNSLVSSLQETISERELMISNLGSAIQALHLDPLSVDLVNDGHTLSVSNINADWYIVELYFGSEKQFTSLYTNIDFDIIQTIDMSQYFVRGGQYHITITAVKEGYVTQTADVYYSVVNNETTADLSTLYSTEVETGAVVTCDAVLVGFYGNYAFLTDGTNYTYVYKSNVETWLSEQLGVSPQVGDTITITGPKDTYNGTVQFYNPTSASFVSGGYTVNSLALSDLTADITLRGAKLDLENIVYVETLANNNAVFLDETTGLYVVVRFADMSIPTTLQAVGYSFYAYNMGTSTYNELPAYYLMTNAIPA